MLYPNHEAPNFVSILFIKLQRLSLCRWLTRHFSNFAVTGKPIVVFDCDFEFLTFLKTLLKPWPLLTLLWFLSVRKICENESDLFLSTPHLSSIFCWCRATLARVKRALRSIAILVPSFLSHYMSPLILRMRSVLYFPSLGHLSLLFREIWRN